MEEETPKQEGGWKGLKKVRGQKKTVTSSVLTVYRNKLLMLTRTRLQDT